MGDPANKYPKPEYVASLSRTVLQHKRVADKVIEHPRDKPGNIIVVHGVNDVGTSFNEVEDGLCAGLERRLFRHFRPAKYTQPTAADLENVVPDPDALYFKRTVSDETDSPVIPFYWGFREVSEQTKTVSGQKTDRYGNRLDKDLSKGGGPFGNATSTLPDMWNRGVGAPADLMNDPLRPLKNGPGRMYMVLAARRLAALIAMIRQYHEHDTVTIVAHSQGCLLSLLAQAFLMELGELTADTLILTHPPYSLDDDASWKVDVANWFAGGKDAAMEAHYDKIAGWQSLHGRLQTLVNIVQGVAKAKASEPAFAKIDESRCGGMVEGRWKPDADRDNRGKVYLYFSPEDMTVALENMKGIGWQGVPDYIEGSEAKYTLEQKKFGRGGDYDIVRRYEWASHRVTRQPLKELGDSFRQRVFTGKLRLDPRTRKTGPVLVGAPQHDFALCIKGEDDHAHVEESGRAFRASLPIATWPIHAGDKPEEQRYGIRAINGEPLATPFKADMRGNQIDADKIPASSSKAHLAPADRGPCEQVDPITAAIAVASDTGRHVSIEHLRPPATNRDGQRKGEGRLSKHECDQVQAAYNEAKHPGSKNPDDIFQILAASRDADGAVVAQVLESPNAARLRWQQALSAKSFHSAIFDSHKNHSQATAWDVAIGSGQASTDPNFYAYLCAVADWRLKKPSVGDKRRLGILLWEKFIQQFGNYLEREPKWRRELIEGSVDYYSFGELPACLPLLTGKLWDIVVSETTIGRRINQPSAPKGNP